LKLEHMEGHDLNELSAGEHIRQLCWPGGQVSCPKCRGTRIYRLSEQRYRCPRCTYTFHDLSRRWINIGGLTPAQWIALSSHFAAELTANQMAQALGVSYNTAYKAMTTLRLAILAQALDSPRFIGREAEIDLGVEYVPQPQVRQPARLPVFGILERAGQITVDLVQGLEGKNLFHFHAGFELCLSRMGKVVYTDRYIEYDALIACCDSSLPYHLLQGRMDPPAINDGRHGFWNFTKGRLRRYSGISPRRFPLYIKELEYRYNRRTEDIRPLLLEALCRYVPD
jgi:transposase